MSNNVTIEIKVLGKENKKITIPEGDYYYADEHIVIKHAPLRRIANAECLFVKDLIDRKDHYINKDDFNYAVEAIGYVGDVKFSAFGEASPSNLTTEIAKSYIYTMCIKRAEDRLFLQMLGLEGTVYSEVEIEEKKQENKLNKPANTYTASNTNKEIQRTSETKTENKPENADEGPGKDSENLTPEKAGEYLVTEFGSYKRNPTKVADLDEGSIKWVLEHDFRNETMIKVQKIIKAFKGVA